MGRAYSKRDLRRTCSKTERKVALRDARRVFRSVRHYLQMVHKVSRRQLRVTEVEPDWDIDADEETVGVPMVQFSFALGEYGSVSISLAKLEGAILVEDGVPIGHSSKNWKLIGVFFDHSEIALGATEFDVVQIRAVLPPWGKPTPELPRNLSDYVATAKLVLVRGGLEYVPPLDPIEPGTRILAEIPVAVLEPATWRSDPDNFAVTVSDEVMRGLRVLNDVGVKGWTEQLLGS